MFFRQLKDLEGLDFKKSFNWLGGGYITPNCEGYICAAQELALFTKYHEKHILKTSQDDRCRICMKEKETIVHLLAGCDNLARKEYIERHNNVCKYVHYVLCQNYFGMVAQNWFQHMPKEVMVGRDTDITWDQSILTDRPIGANKPDILVKDKKAKKVYLIDISCPADSNVIKKESEKIMKYGGLKIELQRMWKMPVVVIPVVVGALGAVSVNLKRYLAGIPGVPDWKMCQKIAILGSQKIMRSVLSR